METIQLTRSISIPEESLWIYNKVNLSGFNQTRDKTHYLYWIEDKDNKFNLNMGWIGVSSDPKRRFSEHTSRNYSSMQILFSGSMENMLKIEKFFRPEPNMGWNISAGGGLNNSPESIQKSITTKRSLIDDNGLDSFQRGSAKSVATRRNNIDSDGLNGEQRGAIKMVERKSLNIDSDGLNSFQRGSIKMVERKSLNINKDGLNSHQIGSINALKTKRNTFDENGVNKLSLNSKKINENMRNNIGSDGLSVRDKIDLSNKKRHIDNLLSLYPDLSKQISVSSISDKSIIEESMSIIDYLGNYFVVGKERHKYDKKKIERIIININKSGFYLIKIMDHKLHIATKPFMWHF